MKQKLIITEKKIKLKHFKSFFDETNNIYYGGIPSPKYLNELYINTEKGLNYKDYQINIKGSKKSLRELGKYLLMLSEFKTNDPDYHEHFDEADNIGGNSELIIHIKNSN